METSLIESIELGIGSVDVAIDDLGVLFIVGGISFALPSPPQDSSFQPST